MITVTLPRDPDSRHLLTFQACFLVVVRCVFQGHFASFSGAAMKPKFKTMDGNEAVANVAYRLNEVIAIYPITPSSNMGEWADQWASEGVPNVWGTVPHVVEMLSRRGRGTANIVRPGFTRQQRVRPVAALSTTDFSSHHPVTTLTDAQLRQCDNDR